MEGLVSEISAKMTMADAEMKKFLTGNKAAGTRARKLTLELEKLYKEFRKESIRKGE